LEVMSASGRRRHDLPLTRRVPNRCWQLIFARRLLTGRPNTPRRATYGTWPPSKPVRPRSFSDFSPQIIAVNRSMRHRPMARCRSTTVRERKVRIDSASFPVSPRGVE
jgi:hypothetical protein